MSGLTDYLSSRSVDGWRTILRYVEENKVHADGSPMLANNISPENAARMLGR